jgi:TatD DNase family protein
MVIEKILEQAKKKGIEKIISVGMSALSQKRVLELSEHYDQIYPALGIHPQEVEENDKIKTQLDEIVSLIRKNKDKLCAIAEVGLDHHFVKNKELYPLQKEIFHKMLELAQEFQLPINLHTKGAEKEIFEALPSYEIPNVNIHWYSGPEDYFKQGIDRGYYYSFNPAIHYSKKIQSFAQTIPLTQILLESDGPVEYRGEPSTPAMIKAVARKISKVKKLKFDELEIRIEKNTKAIFPRIF